MADIGIDLEGKELHKDQIRQLTTPELIGDDPAAGALVNPQIRAGSVGNWNVNGGKFYSGNVSIDSDAEQIRMGLATAVLTGAGIFLGKAADGGYDGRIGNPAGDYLHYDGSTGTLTITGSLIAGSIHIPNTTTAASFHVNTTGNAWGGVNVATYNADPTSALWRLNADGTAYFKSVTLSDSVTINHLATGSILTIQGWTFSGAVTSTDADTVAWGAGTLTMGSGETFAILAGNTGNMIAKTYIYFDEAVSVTVLQTSTTRANAFGLNKVLIAIAENKANEATFFKFGDQEFNIDGAQIMARSVTANEIVASTITANEISANTITGNEILTMNISGKNATFDTGTVGGWTMSATTLANSTNIILDAAGKAISINSATFGQAGIQLQYNTGTPRAYIGNGSTYFFNFDGTNISWGAVATTLSTAGLFTTTSALIGGWNVVDGYIYNLQSGTPTVAPNDGLVLASGNEGVIVYEDTAKRAELGYLSAGVYGLKLYATDGTTPIFEASDTQQMLGGWYFTNTLLRSGTTDANSNVLIDSANTLIRLGPTTGNYMTMNGATQTVSSSNYVTGVNGSGFSLSPTLLEVGNIAARGIFRTSVFQKNAVSVVGGNLLVAPGDKLNADMTALDASTLTISGNETFAVNDIVRIKDGTDDEWLLVTNIASAPTYTVTRDLAGVYAADTNPTWKSGVAVTNYRQSGDGLVYLTASDTNAPYLQIITHAGSPWSSVTERVRLGKLSGITDPVFGALSGYGLWTDNVYLTGGINATSGVIAGAVTFVSTAASTVESGGNRALASLNSSNRVSGYLTSNELAAIPGAAASRVVVGSTGVFLYNAATTNTIALNTDGSMSCASGAFAISTLGAVTIGATATFVSTTASTIETGGNRAYSGLNSSNRVAGYLTSAELAASPGAGASRVILSSSGIYLYNAASANTIALKNDGSATFAGGQVSVDTSGNFTATTLSAISANLGTITAGTITGGTVQTASSGARVVLDTTGIKAYDATTQRVQILNDGSGWFAASDKFSWTTAGVATIGGFTLANNQFTATNLAIISGAANTAHIEVGTGSNLAGLNSGNAAGDIAIWAGDTFANRATAPFRVTEAGAVTMTSATVTGTITANAGSIATSVTGVAHLTTDETIAGVKTFSDFIIANKFISFGYGLFQGSKYDGLSANGVVTRSLIESYIGGIGTESLRSTSEIFAVATWSANIGFRIVKKTDTPGVGDRSFIGFSQTTLGTSLPSATETRAHIGFIFDNGTLWVSNSEGGPGTQERTNVTGSLTLTNWNKYEIRLTSATSILFYVNDTLVATHNTAARIPTANGGGDGTPLLYIGCDGYGIYFRNNYEIYTF